jgi:ribosomal protein S18 acetylase RimI-like enzyme
MMSLGSDARLRTPSLRGRDFAADLVRLLAASIAAGAQTPFLHVFSSNHPTIALYRKLGFALRRQMHLLVLGRADEIATDGNSVRDMRRRQ